MKAAELFGLAQEFTVTEKLVTLAGSAVEQLCFANKSRVALILASTSPLTVTTRPDATTGQGISNGGANTPPFIFVYGQTGALCQQPWYSNFSTPGVLVTVIEVLFRS